MTFAWPFLLPALLVVPVLLAAYWWLLQRRRRRAVPFSSVALIRAAQPSRGTWRRHLPVALLLSALALLGLAAARPQVEADVPVSASSVIVAVDVSGSMCATDVDPNRLSAAQDAVRDFVRRQDDGTRIGLVAFAGFAQLVVEPTTDHDELTNAIDSLTTGRGTAIGAAILKSVDAIAQINPDVPPTGLGLDPGGPGGSGDGSGGQGGSADPAPRASNAPEIVVLLTDGANTLGIAPAEAARSAAERGVRVYPIGFGTTEPTMMVCTAEQLGGNLFENPGRRGWGGGLRGGGGPLVADEPTLRQVASITGGTYFAASDAAQLQEVLEDLPRHVQVQQREIEVSVWLAALAGLLVLLAVGAAVRWSAFPS
jgi:Ca-activated chloride channel family protein